MKLCIRISICTVFACAGLWADAQCGSYSGSDGALNITAPGVTVLNPAVLGLNPPGDNIFQFTTINIAQGATLKLTSEMMRSKPVVFCASGAVTIAGVLDLSGAAGTNVNNANPWLSHTPAQPGPGGFAGGLGAVSFQGVTAVQTSGFGSGAPTCNIVTTTACFGAGAAHATAGTQNSGFGNGTVASGTTYGNAASNPLTGGSGGNGVPLLDTGGIGGGNGGAGGGAIRIVSATSISISGSISAKGGKGGSADTNTPGNDIGLTTGGSGSGGDIHLLAPTISGAGVIDASGGPSVPGGGWTSGGGGAGWILLNTNTYAFTGTLNGFFFSSTYIVPTPVAPPTVTITSINGVSSPANPGGDPTEPDVTIAANAAVPVTITASLVPLGTVVTLTLVPTTGAAVSAQCNPLAGTTASSTATCSVTFPTGVSLTAATAAW